MQFSHKIVKCNVEDMHKVMREVEIEWLTSLLARMKFDPDKLDKIKNHPDYGAQAWRDYAIVDKGVNIIKSASTVVVEKHFADKPKRELGRWERPEVVRVNENGKYHIELHLKYWQLV